jgi:molybdate transport system regulatory protein
MALEPQLRISFRKSIAMGPGKADLLDAIAESGSISAAARKLGMSYRRAWLLVDTMNELGHDVVKRYRQMEKKACASVAREMGEFSELMR